jgi:archaetidylinositol phosphate synthase
VARTLGTTLAPQSPMRSATESWRAVRSSSSLTAGWEKRNLPRIARTLPDWVTPDHLTALAVAAAGLVAVSFGLSNLSSWWMLAAIVGIALHWFGDSLDGTLARVRKMERERYGYFVDHIADAGATVVIFIGFGLSPYVQLSTALLLAISYLLLQIRAEIEAYTSRKFRLSYAWVGPTEARIILAVICVVLAFWTPPLALVLGPLSLTVTDLVCLSIGLIFMAVFVTCSVAEARRLAQIDVPGSSEPEHAATAAPLRYSGYGRHRPSGPGAPVARPRGRTREHR